MMSALSSDIIKVRHDITNACDITKACWHQSWCQQGRPAAQRCLCGTQPAGKIPKQSARSEYQMIFWTTCARSRWPGALWATGQQKIGECSGNTIVTKIDTILLLFKALVCIQFSGQDDEQETDDAWTASLAVDRLTAAIIRHGLFDQGNISLNLLRA